MVALLDRSPSFYMVCSKNREGLVIINCRWVIFIVYWKLSLVGGFVGPTLWFDELAEIVV